MTRLPKISIVTPSFNQGRYIEQTIQSVLGQDYPHLEYIIIDGGSTDETVEIIRKYEKHLACWTSEKDKGQTDAINKGFAKCTGDVFNWINSDDYYEPGALMKVGSLFRENQQIDVVCGREWGFNDSNPEEKILHTGSVIKENVFQTIQTGIIDQPCTFFKKAVIEDFFPLHVSLRYVMDRQLWWSYLLKYGQQSIKQTDAVLTSFRLHPQSKTVSQPGLVEKEFDRLRRSLFETLGAPRILKAQPEEDSVPLNINWRVSINTQKVLAEFASWYAERNYIKDQLAETSELTSLVKKWKGSEMNKRERKLWLSSHLIPKSLLMSLKKIKNTISVF